MKVKDLIKGKKAQEVLEYLLDNYEGENKYLEFLVAGYYKKFGKYICFDNTGWSCYVEEAPSLLLARQWCLGLIEADELYLIQ